MTITFQTVHNLNGLLQVYVTDYMQARGHELIVASHRARKVAEGLGEYTSLSPSDIERFVNGFKGSASSRNRYRSLVKHVLRWGQERDLVVGDVPRGVLRAEPERNERTRRLTAEEEEKLVMFMPPRLRELFYAALDTGLRKGTLLQLTWQDVNFFKGYIVVRAETQKHRKSQHIPMSKRLLLMLRKKYGSTTGFANDVAVFNGRGFKAAWDAARQSAGVIGLHWHDLRGEFASRLDEAGVEVSTTSRLLGHSSLAMTQRYLRPRLGRDAEAIRKLGV